MPVYLTLQPIRCAARDIAVAPGELLPRLFTLTFSGGCFLSHYSAVTDSFPLGNMVLFVARTFLQALMRDLATDRLSQMYFIVCNMLLLHISANDAALRVFDKEDNLVALFCRGQLGLYALEGVADVHAREVEVTVCVLNVADGIV